MHKVLNFELMLIFYHCQIGNKESHKASTIFQGWKTDIHHQVIFYKWLVSIVSIDESLQADIHH